MGKLENLRKILEKITQESIFDDDDCEIHVVKKGHKLTQTIKGNGAVALIVLNKLIKDIQKECNLSDEDLKDLLENCIVKEEELND